MSFPFGQSNKFTCQTDIQKKYDYYGITTPFQKTCYQQGCEAGMKGQDVDWSGQCTTKEPESLNVNTNTCVRVDTCMNMTPFNAYIIGKNEGDAIHQHNAKCEIF